MTCGRGGGDWVSYCKQLVKWFVRESGTGRKTYYEIDTITKDCIRFVMKEINYITDKKVEKKNKFRRNHVSLNGFSVISLPATWEVGCSTSFESFPCHRVLWLIFPEESSTNFFNWSEKISLSTGFELFIDVIFNEHNAIPSDKRNAMMFQWFLNSSHVIYRKKLRK